MGVMIFISLLTGSPPPEKTKGIIWSPGYAPLPAELQETYGGWRDFRIWWALFVGVILCIYGFFIWFRIKHPW